VNVQFFVAVGSPAIRYKASIRASPSGFPLLSGLKTTLVPAKCKNISSALIILNLREQNINS
jgi:hypothetical protein